MGQKSAAKWEKIGRQIGKKWLSRLNYFVLSSYPQNLAAKWAKIGRQNGKKWLSRLIYFVLSSYPQNLAANGQKSATKMAKSGCQDSSNMSYLLILKIWLPNGQKLAVKTHLLCLKFFN